MREVACELSKQREREKGMSGGKLTGGFFGREGVKQDRQEIRTYDWRA